jgi:hypothetical protein
MKNNINARKLLNFFRSIRSAQVARQRSLEFEKRRQHLIVTLKARNDFEKRSRKNIKKNPAFVR